MASKSEYAADLHIGTIVPLFPYSYQPRGPHCDRLMCPRLRAG
jgi:hypothetical protein